MKRENSSEKGKAWLKKEMRPYRTIISFLAILSVAATLFSLAFAYLVRYLINSASQGDKTKLLVFALVLLFLLLFKIFLHTLVSFLSERARAKINAELRTKLFSKILRSDYASVQAYHSGELLTRLTTDIQEIAVDSVGLLQSLASMITQCIGATVALLTIDPLFTCIYIVGGLLIGGISALFRKLIKKQHKEFMEADGASRSFMQEGLSSILTLKAYGAEARTTAKAENYASQYYEKRMKRNKLRAVMNGLFSLLSNTGMIFAVVWCSVSVLNGNDDYGSILSVILLLMQLQQPFASFSGIIPVFYARIASGERLAEIEEIPEERSQSLGNEGLYRDLNGIRLENVGFSYGRETILDGADALFEKGKIICVTGASGSGKSTLFRLLLSVYQPTEGSVYLDFTHSSELLTEKARGLFAYVPQGNFLFSGTIRENLLFFSDDTEGTGIELRLKEALQAACATFAFDLPEGLETVLSERGGGLSEGQLQRLAVARALVSDRPILLLDEATSALDSETERTLLQNIKDRKEKTCIIVTHRPAALEIADSILKVENGKIHKACI
ncbi:MAG: ABC transporter ATP-binding protein [Clostridia bacterium]|nr:ABC transporter ATP-binding protein [Clostridia bacterium]